MNQDKVSTARVLFVGAVRVPLEEEVSMVSVSEANVFLGTAEGRLSLFDTNLLKWNGQWTCEGATTKKKYSLLGIAARSPKTVALLEVTDSEVFCSEATARGAVVTSVRHRLACIEKNDASVFARLDASVKAVVVAIRNELFFFSDKGGLRLDRRFALASPQQSITCLALHPKDERIACAIGSQLLIPGSKLSWRSTTAVRHIVFIDSLLAVVTIDNVISGYEATSSALKVRWRVPGAHCLYPVVPLGLLFDDRRQDDGIIRVYDATIAETQHIPTLLCDQSLASSATDGKWRRNHNRTAPPLLATTPQLPHGLQRLILLQEPGVLLLLTLRPRFASFLHELNTLKK